MDIEEIVESVYQKGKPILYLDTCAYLDILRSPVRSINSDKIISLAKKLIDSKELVILSSDTIELEFFDNIDSVYTEVRDSILKHMQYNRNFVDCANALLITGEAVHTNLYQESWLELLKGIPIGLINESFKVPLTSHEREKASIRVETNKSPAKKGKNSLKDCLILESLLKFSELVRDKGFSEKIIFITSNTEDFGKVKNCFVQDDLAEFDIDFVNTLNHAISKLHIS